MEQQTALCANCGQPATTPYCGYCGKQVELKRITVSGMLHEAFHFFTRLDKGFPYTLKKLITQPGILQRKYIAGERSLPQKPFSMFFLCASFAAVSLYWINSALIRYYDAGDSAEAHFFHKYWVLLQVSMLPVYTAITCLFFRNSKKNYAEIMVLQLYLFSFLFVMLTAIHLLKFIVHDLQTRYIELPAIILYSLISNVNFFQHQNRLSVVSRSVISIALSFLVASLLQDWLVSMINK